MTEFSDRVYASLLVSEGYVPTIYKDGKGIPTIGMGYALVIPQGGTYKLRDNIDVILSSYLEDNPSLIPSVKTALEQARDALNKVSGAVNPFAAGYVLLANPTRLQQEIAKYGSAGTREKFKTDFWEGSNGVFNRYLTSAQNAVGINKWNKLTDNERTALYSLVYNGGSGMIGGGMDQALDLMTNNGASSTADKTTFTKSQFIGYLQFIYEILYRSNPARDAQGNLIPNRDGVQNRRFFEASEAIGSPLSSLPNAANASLTVPTATTEQAILTMAFLNTNLSTMYNYIASIDGYKFADSKLSAYSFIQKHAEASYNELIKHIDYKSMRSRYNIPAEKFAPEFELKNLFVSWQLYNDLCFTKDESGKLSGETSYKIPDLSDKNEMFIMTHKNIAKNGVKVIDAKGGDDYIYTKSLVSGETFKAYLGAGYDTYIGGDADDWVDGGLKGDNWYTYNHIELGGGNNTYIGTAGKDTVSTIAKNNAGKNNTVYLGSGSDTFLGSDANDWVDGGTGYKQGATDEEARNLNDLGTDINTIYLGGGNDTYVGGKTEDMPDGFWGNGSNIIFGGTENDKEVYKNEAGEITGWADHDQVQTVNKIYFGRGNNEYYGTKGIDIVDAKTSISASANKAFLGGGDDIYYCGSGKEVVHTGSGNNKVFDAAYGDKIYLEGTNNEVTTSSGATFYLSAGSRNEITAQYGCTLSGQFNTTNINLEKEPEHNTLRYEKQENDLFILYHGHSIYLENYFNNDGTVNKSKGLPTINGQTLHPSYPQAINEETYSYNLGEDMPGERDNQPAAGLTPTSTTESALLVQAISSFNPGSSSSTGDLSSENWKAPELYSPGTVREMMKNIA